MVETKVPQTLALQSSSAFLRLLRALLCNAGRTKVPSTARWGKWREYSNITSKQSFAKTARPQHCENITFCLRKACKPVVAGNGAASRGCRAAVWLKKSAQNVTGRFCGESLVETKVPQTLALWSSSASLRLLRALLCNAGRTTVPSTVRWGQL